MTAAKVYEIRDTMISGGSINAAGDLILTTFGGATINAGTVVNGLNVKNYGAMGDNVTDDAAAIQLALDSCPPGGVVEMPPGVYRTSVPLVIPPGVTLLGTRTGLMFVTDLTDPPGYIRPLAGFTGSAVIKFLDAVAGGYADISGEQRVLNLMIDGSDLSTPSVDGISAEGNVQNVGLRDVTIRRVTGAGIRTGISSGFFPYSWRLHRVMVDKAGWRGFSFEVMTDITMVDCQAIGSGADGFYLLNLANSQAIGCRAEWNGDNGFHVTGNWATGAGSGGMLFGDCSTDRNDKNGVLVDATGNPPIQFDNLHTRRDGRNANAGGGGYAGLKVAGATTPIIVGLMTCYPGVDDNAAGTNSPQYGVRVETSTFVSVASGFLHAATTAWSEGTGNTAVRRGPNIGARTGTTAAPVNDFDAGWAAAGYSVLSGGGQSDGKFNYWSGTKDTINIGSVGGGVAIKEGTNARMGVVTLAAGTATVNNTSVTANTRIQLTAQTSGASGTPGAQRVSARTAGTSFTITSTSATDTCVVAWEMTEPAT
jgi:hypothetical protein